jgi:tripartite-type tricarboxylate transporter receptor subunit TctC
MHGDQGTQAGFEMHCAKAEVTDLKEHEPVSAPCRSRGAVDPRHRARHCKLAALAHSAVAAAMMLLASPAPAPAQNAPVSFAGKQVRLLIGFSPTAYGYDTYGRLLARYIGKYLPGNPLIVPENRPGAGSLSLASYMAHAAPHDGSEIAIVGRGIAMEPILDAPHIAAKFDSTTFTWLGSMNNEVGGFFVREPGPVKDFQDVLRGTALKVGSTGAGGDQQIFTQALNVLFGTRLKPVAGYPGTQELMLAIERGELDGIVGYSWSVARSGNKEQLDNGTLRIILQVALNRHPDLPNVPLVTDFVKNPTDRQVLDLIFSRNLMGRPLLAPPGLDPGVAAALRKAFAAAMHDPALIAEAKKIDLELNYVSGEDVQALIERLYRSPPDVIARAQAIAAAN